MKEKTKKKWLYYLIGMALLIYFLYYQNNSLVTSEYTITSNNLPKSFHNYKIVQLSDLHSKLFGEDQEDLLKRVNRTEPDLIVFTGDLIDSNRSDEQTGILLMEKLIEIAPVFYVTGNHEWWSGKFNELEEDLESIGVQVMRNTSEYITIGEDKIQIIGLDDPAIEGSSHAEKAKTEENIKEAITGFEGEDHFRILLSHRPELFSLYSDYGFELVFSGHAHGGQFRIPFVGGLIAPDQGLFPEFTSGEHHSEGTTMIVNRGLGNSIVPFRIFNHPEIVVVTLRSA